MSWRTGSANQRTRPIRTSSSAAPAGPAPRSRSSLHRWRSRATAEATASETSSNTAGGSDSANGRRARISPSSTCWAARVRAPSRTVPSRRTRWWPVGVATAWVRPVRRRISGQMSATARSSGSATSIRLSGATTVTRQKPVAAVVLTCLVPLVGGCARSRVRSPGFAVAHDARATLPGRVNPGIRVGAREVGSRSRGGQSVGGGSHGGAPVRVRPASGPSGPRI